MKKTLKNACFGKFLSELEAQQLGRFSGGHNVGSRVRLDIGLFTWGDESQYCRMLWVNTQLNEYESRMALWLAHSNSQPCLSVRLVIRFQHELPWYLQMLINHGRNSLLVIRKLLYSFWNLNFSEIYIFLAMNITSKDLRPSTATSFFMFMVNERTIHGMLNSIFNSS